MPGLARASIGWAVSLVTLYALYAEEGMTRKVLGSVTAHTMVHVLSSTFFAALLLDAFSARHSSIDDHEHRLHTYLFFVYEVALSTHLLLLMGAGGTQSTWWGSEVTPLRFLEWSVTTPSLLVLLRRLVGGPVWHVVVADLVMLAAGFWGSVMGGWTAVLAMVLSVVCFVYIVSWQWTAFGASARAAVNPEEQRAMLLLRLLAVVVWTMFPAVMLLSMAGHISSATVDTLFSVADCCAKGIHSRWVLRAAYNALDKVAKTQRVTHDRQTHVSFSEVMDLLGRSPLSATKRRSAVFSTAALRSLSHELRTPLNTIIGFNTLLLESAIPVQRKRESMHALCAAEALHAVVCNVVTWSDMEAGQPPPGEVAEWSLSAAIEESVWPFAAMAELVGTTVSVEMDIAVPRKVRAVKTQVQLVLAAVLHNAVKFSGSGGRVVVRVGVAPSVASKMPSSLAQAVSKALLKIGGDAFDDDSFGRDDGDLLETDGPASLEQDEMTVLRATRATSFLTFEVEDEGMGVGECMRTAVLRPFVQEGTPVQGTMVSGVGLGLAVCNTVCSHAGCTLKVGSRADGGRGTLVRWRLPATCAEVHPPRAAIKDDVMVVLRDPRERATVAAAAKAMWRLSDEPAQTSVVDRDPEALGKLLQGPGVEVTAVVADCALLLQEGVSALLWGDAEFDEVVNRIKGATARLVVVCTSFEYAALSVKLNAAAAAVGRNLQCVLLRRPLMRDAVADALRADPIFNVSTSDPLSLSSSQDAVLFNGMHALVVDDHALVRKVIVRLLKSLQVTCDTAENGEEACKKAASGRYHVIFMDIRMPVMDGIEATRKIVAMNLDPPPLMVAITASSAVNQEQEAKAAGIHIHLQKPVAKSSLKQVLTEVLRTERNALFT